MFSRQLPLKTLTRVCRSLGTMLQSGVPILKAIDTTARKGGDARLRWIFNDLGTSVSKGDDLTTAMRRHDGAFPELMLNMVDTAEQTGTLPEVLFGLADHYENNLRLRRQFVGQIAWPIIQLVAAILIIAMVILVLGMIADSGPGPTVDLLGLGLKGPSGAIYWLGSCFGVFFAGWMTYMLLVRGLGAWKAIDSVLLMIPVVGHCMQSFAQARFAWAFHLTQESGMSIGPSLQASLDATSNGAFVGAAPQIIAMVHAGDELSYAMRETGVFSEDFLQIVEVGESTGTVPESLERISPHLEESARRSLSGLTFALGWVIWSMVATLIIFLIFRMILNYIDLINKAAAGDF